MAVNDLSNKQLATYDYMKGLLAHEFPNLDISDTSGFMETFGTPQLKLLVPLMNYLDRIALKQSLENATNLTDAEMDELAAKEYFIRGAGKKAQGIVTLILRDIPPTNTLQITAHSLFFLSKTGLRFSNTNTISIDETQLGNYYDPDTFRFKIPVVVDADNVGANYNLQVGDISRMETPMPFMESVTNEVAFSLGQDRETNVQLADRMRKGSNAPSLGTRRGYVRFLTEKFPDIRDLLVVGFGHPLMQRDIIGTIPNSRFDQTVHDVHWGTKVDLYIRGQVLTDFAEYLVVQTIPGTTDIGVFLTKTPVYDVKLVSRVSSDPATDPAALQITNYSFMKDENSGTIGTMNEKAWVVIHDTHITINQQIQVNYRFNSLIASINDAVYQQDDRPPTADLLPKEAPRQYVAGSIVLKQNNTPRLRELDKTLIRQRAYNWLDGLGMGGEIQFSDINDAIINADSTNKFVDYIHLPPQFITFDNTNKYVYYCLGTEARAFLENLATQNLFTAATLGTYKDRLTIYDFFDCLHILLFDNGLQDAVTGLTAISADWAERIRWLQWGRDMATRGKTTNMLSPAKYVVKENQFFELSQLSVYEDKLYTQDDWGNLISLYETLATSPAGSTAPTNVLHLTYFCMAIIYLSVNKDRISAGIPPFFTYFQNATRTTPIQDQFTL